MAKVTVTNHDGVDYVRYECPGCKHQHSVPTDRWAFNGDVNKPTLSPSVRHFIPVGTYTKAGGEKNAEQTTCHYFVRDGFIEYCGDCEHNFRNQRVELPDMKDDNDEND